MSSIRSIQCVRTSQSVEIVGIDNELSPSIREAKELEYGVFRIA
jgi:hypothetical protein